MAGGVSAWLLEPCGRSVGGRRRWFVASLLWLLATGPVVSHWIGPVFHQSDVKWYLMLARGEHGVMAPFASRQLAPLLVRWLCAATGMPIEQSFVLEGIVAYAVFAACVLWLVVRAETPRWVILAIAGMAFWGFSLYALAFPDLLFAALTAIFLLLLSRRQDAAAALMLMPMTVSREATLLSLLCLIIAGWQRMRARMLLLAVAAMLLGSAAVKQLSHGQASNAPGMPPALYMFGKLPWNALRNLTGADPYTNLSRCAVTPLWQHPFHLRAITAIGICRMESFSARFTYGALTVCFGVLPVVLLWAWRRRAVPWRDQTVLVRFCLVYGMLSYALAPGLGTGVDRLVRYAWPLFLVALPRLLMQIASSHGDLSPGPSLASEAVANPSPEEDWAAPAMRLLRRVILPLLLVHLAVSWSEVYVRLEDVLLVSMPGTLVALWLLRPWAGQRPGSGLQLSRDSEAAAHEAGRLRS